ncbi:MAG: PD-(D/E)XK nuclease family protein [Candidatus Micrarchaeia archaeon]
MQPKVNVLERLHLRSIRISDIASQYWCEKQMELKHLFAQKKNEYMKEGTLLHEALEEEVNIPVVMEPKTYADSLYKSIYTSYLGLKEITKNRLTRELIIFGSLNGFKIVGKIDQLEYKDGKIIIEEDKTKAGDFIPEGVQSTPHKVQLILYKKMLEDISHSKYTIENFRVAYGTKNLKLSEAFINQLDAMGIEKRLQDIEQIAGEYFKIISSLKISDTTKVRYINQFTRKEIGAQTFLYNEEEANEIIKFVLKYWNGEREAMPVPFEERWKCRYCQFFGKECKIWYPQKVL